MRATIPRSHRRAAAVLGVAAALTLATACSSGVSTPQGAPAGGSARSAGGTAPSAGGPGGCSPGSTCYTPRQLEAAYGVRPLLQRGIDGRGETVVLPEL